MHSIRGGSKKFGLGSVNANAVKDCVVVDCVGAGVLDECAANTKKRKRENY